MRSTDVLDTLRSLEHEGLLSVSWDCGGYLTLLFASPDVWLRWASERDMEREHAYTRGGYYHLKARMPGLTLTCVMLPDTYAEWVREPEEVKA